MTFSPAREPHVNGWATSVTDSGVYRGHLLDELTDYQRATGCRDVVEAGTREELEQLCHAHLTFIRLVRLAELDRETAAAGFPGGRPAAAPLL